MNSACSLPLPGCLGISWRSSHAAGQNQPQRHSQPLRYVKLPHLQSTVGLSFSFYTLILSSATSTPEPSPVPNPAADAPALLAPIPHDPFWMSQLSRLTSHPSADSFSFVTATTSALQSVWMVLQFVVQISLLHSAVLFHVSQASRTALRSFTSGTWNPRQSQLHCTNSSPPCSLKLVTVKGWFVTFQQKPTKLPTSWAMLVHTMNYQCCHILSSVYTKTHQDKKKTTLIAQSSNWKGENLILSTLQNPSSVYECTSKKVFKEYNQKNNFYLSQT